MTERAAGVSPDLTELCSVDLPVIRCRFDYADRAGQISKRDLRLCRFFTTEDGRHYLEGVCVLRGDRRTFRLDRLQSALTHHGSGVQFQPATFPEQLGALIRQEVAEPAQPQKGKASRSPWALALLGLLVGVVVGASL
ncbi:WYL domain-containing protein [Ferrimonas balearica]|uniref:WYL domain-containing protein n=1 Tax=Ferrimonas balearica TaxID=44012 RepID=UPI001C98FDAA|nr:WYL domain-containing protein [Ferrimonas balearica]MBY5991667.1 WYL domain-containing protein [Ferrimonas balearica]